MRLVKFSLLCMLALAAATPLAAQTSPYKELILPTFPWNSLQKDLPVRSLHLSRDAKQLAMVGRKAMWLWNLETSRLQRVGLAKGYDATTDLRHVRFVDDENLVVTSNQSLFHINLKSGKILRFVHDEYASGVDVGFGGDANAYYWLHSDGIRKLDLQKLTLRKVFGHSLFQPEDKAWFSPAANQLWIVRDRLVLRKDLNGGRVKTSLVHKGSVPFTDLLPFQEHVFVYTPHTVLRFAPPESLFAAIPVEGTRKLVAVDFSHDRHGYLFDDNLLEVYELASKRRVQYVINELTALSQITAIEINGPIAALIVDGRPQVLFLN